MIYSFLCPTPCSHEIFIDAKNDDDAVIKLMKAGALHCRNAKYRCRCEKSQHYLSPISEGELNRIVRMCMRNEQEKQENYSSVLASLHG